MGGIPIRQPLPTHHVEQVDPFLLLHHHYGIIEPNTNPKQVGVGPHPHRGFSPVTFIFKGDVHHRDSRGNDAIVQAGGVQWMNAGMGVIHSERPSDELAAKGGEQEIIQLWINTPGALKLQQPAYFSINNEDIPTIFSDDKKVSIKVVAGEWKDKRGFMGASSPLLILEVLMEQDGQYCFPVDETYNLMVYNMDARVFVDGFGIVDDKYLIWFQNNGSEVTIKAQGKTRLLILAGKPIDEPVTSYGPFVMNTQTEIMQAIRDYQMGKMGILIEE